MTPPIYRADPAQRSVPAIYSRICPLPVAETAVSTIASWIVERGLSGGSEVELREGFCRRCRDAGIRLSNAIVIIDILHPVYEGRAFKWRANQRHESQVSEHVRTTEVEAAGKSD